MSPVSPGCHVSTASRCPPASSGGQRCPPVFWPVNMAGNMPWYFSEGPQPLAPGSGIPPAAARSVPGVKEVGSSLARPDVAPGGALLPSRRATPGFGTGGAGRNRTGGAGKRLSRESATDVLLHITAGAVQSPAAPSFRCASLTYEQVGGPGPMYPVEGGPGVEPGVSGYACRCASARARRPCRPPVPRRPGGSPRLRQEKEERKG